jgi:hypothetical protein
MLNGACRCFRGRNRAAYSEEVSDLGKGLELTTDLATDLATDLVIGRQARLFPTEKLTSVRDEQCGDGDSDCISFSRAAQGEFGCS